jgi:hypothetical protein
MFGLGFAITKEKNLMTIGAGMAAFCVLAVALNLAGIPLTWWIFLLLALAYPAYAIIKGERDVLSIPKFEFRKEIFLVLVVAIAIAHLWVYYDGAFKYPYLEDDDPWVHAAAVKYVAQTQTASRYFDRENFVRYYIEPYPPTYDILMAMAHQFGSPVIETLKALNVVMISLVLIFAFYFVQAFTKSQELGLYSVFVLAALPSFMSHFIWSQTLAMAVSFVALYALAKIGEGKRYEYLFAVAMAALVVAQPSVAAIMCIMIGISAAARVLEDRKLLRPVIAFGVGGIILTTALYWIPTYLKYGEKTLDGIGLYSFSGTFMDRMSDTSGGVIYTLDDFLFPLPYSKMDQETGIGWVVAGLTIAGFFACLWKIRKRLQPEETYLAVSAIWLVFAILGTQGNALPFKLFPHRFWVFLSIPVAIFCAFAIRGMLARFSTREFRYGAAIAIFVGIMLTSAQAKYAVQTSYWPPGVEFVSANDANAFVSQMNALPKNTKIFPLCSSDNKVLAFDMFAEPFAREYADFKRAAWSKTWPEIHEFLKKRGYGYVMLDTYCFTAHPQSEAQERLNAIPQELFSVYNSSQGQDFILVLLKVN